MIKSRHVIALAAGLLFAQLAVAENWQLVWQDEFHGSIGPDWVFETGGGGWGNNEQEYYRQENATVENDALVITARHEDFNGYHYTSARMKTQGRKTFTYGRMEARIAVPGKTGLWPAFWMLGSDIGTVGWPASGEIDILEQINAANTVYGTAHWQGSDGNHWQFGGRMDTSIQDYHIYAVEWSPTTMRWFVDGQQFNLLSIADGIAGTEEFQKDFFVLLNMAVGGNWPGFVIDDAALPARMLVDYVRVYQPVAGQSTSAVWASQDMPASVIRHRNGRGRIDPEKKVTPIGDGNWSMIPGLGGSGVSFQSQDFPGRYLRHHADNTVWLDENDGTVQFKQDATFVEHPGLAKSSAVSFESLNLPGQYLHHRKALLYVEAVSTPAELKEATFVQKAAQEDSVITIEAENYGQMSGVNVETNAAGGQDVTGIDTNDWIIWDIDVPATGTYTVKYRVAAAAAGGKIQLEKAGGGQAYGTVDVPATGGAQTWNTVSNTIQLTAGPQQIGFKALAGGFNLDWLKFKQKK